MLEIQLEVQPREVLCKAPAAEPSPGAGLRKSEPRSGRFLETHQNIWDIPLDERAASGSDTRAESRLGELWLHAGRCRAPGAAPCRSRPLSRTGTCRPPRSPVRGHSRRGFSALPRACAHARAQHRLRARGSLVHARTSACVLSGRMHVSMGASFDAFGTQYTTLRVCGALPSYSLHM